MNTDVSKVHNVPIPTPRTAFGKIRLPNLGLRVSERKLLLVTGDLFLLNAALFLSLFARDNFTLPTRPVAAYLPWFLLVTTLWALIAILADLYNLARAANATLSALTAGSTTVAVTLLFLLIPYITPVFPSRRFYFFLFPVLAATTIAAWRVLYATLIVQPVFRRTAIVVGAGHAAHTLLQAIHSASGDGQAPWQNTIYQILGFIDDDPHKQKAAIAGIPVLGTRHDLLNLVRRLQPDELVISITHLQDIHQSLFQAILDCRELGVAVTTMPQLYEGLTGRVAVEHAGRNISVVLPADTSNTYRLYLALRRCFDLGVALVGCLFLALLVPVVWLANRLLAPGPLFYSQERIGKGGHSFQVHKFRSMVIDAEQQTGAVWASANDPRVTPVGRILRKTRLDEVPQFWNVLKGDMSLFGPRPERPDFVAKLNHHIPFYRMRHAVRPGITGWAQINYDYGASIQDALIKLQYDLYYIKHQSLYLDLLILLKTIRVVLGLKGR